MNQPKIHTPSILFEDGDLIVVDKPTGMLAEKNPWETSVQDFVAQHCGRSIRIKDGPGVVHRLDRVTSGIIIMAKKASVLKVLNAAIANREIEKEYTAEVEGKLIRKSGSLIHHLAKDNTNRVAKVFNQPKRDTQKAELDFWVIEERHQSTLLKINLKTGRYHQIRAQFAFIGHPIIGDSKYGSKIENSRVHLHASKVSFRHPVKGNAVTVESPVVFADINN